MTQHDSAAAPAPIDFDKAFLSWITRDGSHGRWRLSAVATRLTAAGVADRFVLAPAVMAGDVYGEGRLPLDPPYSFQIFAATDRHAIIRDFPSGSPKTDSAGANADVFSELAIHAPSLHGDRLSRTSLTPESIAQDWPLTTRVKLDANDGSRWLLDFPVVHANAKRTKEKAAFQIETGPILVPAALIDDAALAIAGFGLAYVFFNRWDRLDLSLWGPIGRDREGGRGYAHFCRIAQVGINLYCRDRMQPTSA